MEKKHKNINNLSPAEISKFKTLLLAKRNEILGNVLTMEEETLRRQRSDLSNMPIHIADAGSDNYEIENTLGLMGSERKLVREIDEALDRVENGTYAICQGNGEPIPKARLEAIPWAKYCVEYANMLEKGLVRNRTESYLSDSGYDYSEDEENEDQREPF
jgi:RNA polymerase-binding transcription factor DksA